MKRYVLVGIAVLAAACGSSSPSSPSAQPNTVVFTAAMLASNEAPNPVTNADKDAKGNATITFHLTRDSSGTITNATVDFVYSLSGFPAGTPIILTHIHEGGPNIAGGVKVNSGLSAATAITLNDGSATNVTFTNCSYPDGLPLIQKIIDNPNGYYFNVHSQLNPGGAVRGQLVRQ